MIRRALLLLTLLLLTFHGSLASDEAAEENLDVSIRLQMTWDDVGKHGNVNIWESGTASFVVRGRVKLEESGGGSLHYVPDGLKASWRWRHVYTVSPKVKARDACPPRSVLSVETGSGNTELGEDDLVLQVMMQDDPQGGMYVIIVKKLIDTTIEQRQRDCFPAPYPDSTTGKRFYVLQAQGRMKHGGIRGHHRSHRKENVSVGALEVQSMELVPGGMRAADVPDGNVRVAASWRAGKPRLLQIQRREGGEWGDVTYEEGDPPIDVLVGERVELRALVLPAAEEAPDGRWTIPDPVVQDWVVEGGKEGCDEAEVDRLDADERQGGSVRFCWWGPSGEKTVSVETSQGGARRAEARFRVTEPETVVRTVTPLASRFAVATKPDGNEELVCIVAGEPTITFRHEELPWTTPGETQYVQLVKTDARTEMGPSSSVGDCMELHVEGLDTSYPYAPGPRTQDTPGAPATTYDLKISVLYELEMFLMYRPETEGAIWVPLRVVPWTWHGEASRQVEGGTWDVSGSRMTRDPADARADRFPTWKRVVTEDLEWSPCGG